MMKSSYLASPESEHCDPNSNFTMIIPGWNQNLSTFWANDSISQFLKHRGGCVYFMDYTYYGDVFNYFKLVSHFDGVADILTKKFKQIENFDRQFCFGFSFGSRLCVEAGIRIGNQKIPRMDLCDPAGPGFDGLYYKDPQLAAKNVACINTSNLKGTQSYVCHQNYRMGNCGWSQPGDGWGFGLDSHDLCPMFYNAAFDNKFKPMKFHLCPSYRYANVTPDVALGYLADFDREHIRGDIFIATAAAPPFAVINNVI